MSLMIVAPLFAGLFFLVMELKGMNDELIILSFLFSKLFFRSLSVSLAPYDTDRLKDLEEKTGYPKVYFFGAISFLLTGILTLIGGAKLIVDLLGFVYPAYMSFKSMESQGDDTQWLTYWVVFSFFSIFESCLGILVNFIPFYFWIKIGLIVWMYYPQTQGAKMIYEQALRPILLPYLEIGTSGKTTKKSE
jgi:receptor expression-enhancing protein 5/6